MITSFAEQCKLGPCSALAYKIVRLFSAAGSIQGLMSDVDYSILCLTLCLYRVEEGELLHVERLEGGVPESRHGQRLKIQQLCGGRVLLRQDQVAE